MSKIEALTLEQEEALRRHHTDEHGCNGIGAGLYEIRGKRELRDEIERVQD